VSRHGKPVYEFGPFRLDTSDRLLLRDGRPVPLTPKAFETLVALVEHRGRLLEKDDLIKKVWPDTFVEEGNLTNNIWTLRKALGEDENGQKYIETIPRRGYRFVAPVREVVDESSVSPAERRADSELLADEIESEEPDQPGEVSKPGDSPSPNEERPDQMSIRRVVLALAIFSVLVASFLYVRHSAKSQEAPSAARIHSMAVLPFKPVGAQSGDEHLELGMADALITKLSNIRQFNVRPTRAVARYTDRNQDLLAVGRELRVDAILDGTFQRDGERVRITVQLIDARNGKSLWAENFDERWTDIFALQDRVSERVAEALTVRLSAEDVAHLRRRYTDNAEAYQLYLRGRFHWNKRTGEGLRKAIEYFNQAIETDPNYALAHAGLAESYVLLPWYGGTSPEQDFNKARAAATRALAIDDKLAEAHTALAYVAERYDWDWATAEREYRRALQLRRNYPTAHQWYAEYLVQVGRLDEATAEMKKALELDPLSLIIATEMANVHFHARQYDQAIEQLREALEIDPNFAPAHVALGRCYTQKGMNEQAHAEFMKALGTDKDNPWVLSNLGYHYAVWGKKDEAREILDRLRVRSSREPVAAELIATLYAGLGENDLAFEWLGKSCRAREPGMAWMKVHPGFDRLRLDPRFAQVLRCVGLPT